MNQSRSKTAYSPVCVLTNRKYIHFSLPGRVPTNYSSVCVTTNYSSVCVTTNRNTNRNIHPFFTPRFVSSQTGNTSIFHSPVVSPQITPLFVSPQITPRFVSPQTGTYIHFLRNFPGDFIIADRFTKIRFAPLIQENENDQLPLSYPS